MGANDSQRHSAVSWLEKLRERKLVQWAIAYVAGAWLILQVLDTIGPRWGLTDGAVRVIDIALIVGFFVALVVAWYHGEKGRQRVSGAELIIVGALLFIGGLVLQLLQSDSDTAAQSDDEAQILASTTAAPSPLQSIAVLPFDNYSPNPDDAYFAAGITEEITSQLSRIGDLTVVSRVAVERAIKSEDDLDAIARRLRAGSVLEGSVRMAGSQVRISAQLIDMGTGQHLWAESFDRDFSDIFQIQTDVALAIGEALLTTLSTGERQQIEKPATTSIRAYQLYLKQTTLLGNVPEDNQQAIELLHDAVALDPQFAVALARLSWRYGWKRAMEGDQELAKTSLTFARQAISLDPTLVFAYFALGHAYRSLDQFEASYEAFDKALMIDPNFESGLLDGSQLDAERGLIERALKRAFRVVRLDPNAANTRWHAFLPLLFLGDAERAAAWLDLAEAEGMRLHRLDIERIHVEVLRGNVDGAIELAHAVMRAHADVSEAITWASSLLFILGDWQSVRDQLVAMGRSAPDSSYTNKFLPRTNRTILAFVLAEEGHDQEAKRLFDESLALAEASIANDGSYYLRFIEVAAIYAYRGFTDQALAALERAFAAGFMADYMLRPDPMFQLLHSDPRFTGLLGRMVERRSELQNEVAAAGALAGYDKMIAAGPLLGSE